jgi:hypothetical protein
MVRHELSTVRGVSSSIVRPRGPRTAAVYWRRRLVLLAVTAAVLVVGFRWFGGDGEDAPATTPVADTSASATGTATKTPPSPVQSTPVGQQVHTRLAAPSESCDVADVAAVPDVLDTDAGGAVPLRLAITTLTAQACTLRLSSSDIVVEVTSGDELIWRSSACPDALPSTSVILRRGWISHVEMQWDGRLATEECGDGERSAEPGYYWAEAAVIGGEPARSQFQLTEPPPEPSPIRTPTPSPESEPESDAQSEPESAASSSPAPSSPTASDGAG